MDRANPTGVSNQQSEPNGPPKDEPKTEAQESVADEPAYSVSWEASEYVFHQKGAVWYAALAGLILVLVVIAALTQQWISIGVFVIMGIALMMYANRPPQVLKYTLSQDGVTIGEKVFPWESFKSFAVFSDVAWHSIELEPVQRFMPRLSIMFEDEKLEEIVGALSTVLPEEPREPDIIDRLSRYLKF